MSLRDVLGDDGGLERHIAAREASWEETAVRTVLRWLGLCSIGQLRQAAKDLGLENDKVGFAALHGIYYDLPCVFVASRVPYVHQITLLDLAKRFTKTSVFRAWEVCEEQMGPQSVMVFPWPDLCTTVMHRQTPSEDEDDFVFRKYFKGVTYTIEPLQRFLRGLAASWSPPT